MLIDDIRVGDVYTHERFAGFVIEPTKTDWPFLHAVWTNLHTGKQGSVILFTDDAARMHPWNGE